VALAVHNNNRIAFNPGKNDTFRTGSCGDIRMPPGQITVYLKGIENRPIRNFDGAPRLVSPPDVAKGGLVWFVIRRKISREE